MADDLDIDPALFDDGDVEAVLAVVQERYRTPALDDGPDATEPEAPATAVQTLALVEVLPAGFDLPALVRFVPDQALKARLDDAVAWATSIDVASADGMGLADAALATVRAEIRAVTTHFAEPAELAHQVHRAITSRRAEWLEPGEQAVRVVGNRIAAEHSRVAAIAAEERRKAQAEADRIAREERQREAEAAKSQGAPAAVVEQMQQAAAVATAPPVPVAPTVRPLAHSTVVKTWKARLKGTPADADPNPSTSTLTPAQIPHALDLLKAIAAGLLPIALVDFNWSLLNARAKAEKGTLTIAGVEPYEDQGTRAKSGRRA